ncbi:MAG: hypothetical protein GOU97_03765 [Nanoarchaeota archaeon]|nr:hypothetical protein [Nanoarchaeota archaeon]
MNPRKKPRFMREEAFKRKKVSKNWRKPRGWASKLRRKEKQKPKHPNPGFGAPKKTRGLHPSEHMENLVKRIKDVGELKTVKIGKVGAKKKREIVQHCVKNKIKILNVRNPKKYLEKTVKIKKARKKKELAKEKPKKKEEKKEETVKKIGEEKKAPTKKTVKGTLKKK